MKLNRRNKQWVILSGLLVVLAFSVYRMLVSTGAAPGTPQMASSGAPNGPPLDLKDIYLRKNSKKTSVRKEVSFHDVDPSLHLERLTNFDPGTPLNARNMFSVAAVAERSVSGRDSGRDGANPPPGLSAPVNPNPTPTRPAGPPPVIINLKFFGTKIDLPQSHRQGFFADGDEVYLASEGDLVANRYRVIRIGEASAEIEEVSSKTRQQINLQ
jgi:hypothetical protein